MTPLLVVDRSWHDQRVTATYDDVDRSDDPQGAVDWQERVDSWPAIQAYKRHSFEQLRGETQILDLGCGPGEDAAAVSAEEAFGVDRSWTMCTRAFPRVGRVCQGEAVHLPFADAVFGGCRADRVLVHLADPVQTLHELLRVTRPGGRIVLADPDQETLVIEVPGVRRELADAVKALRRDVGYRHGRLAAQLPALLASLGIVDISTAAFPLVLTDPDDAFGLPSWVTGWRELGGFDDRDVAEWDAAIARARETGMVYALLYFVVAGTTP
jgi:SAM-dependent methyltransferase